MSSAQGQRIEANCKLIWGNDDYDLEIENENYDTYWCSVKKDFGSRYGPPLTMTGICNSETQAWDELDRMLGLWARQVQSGKPMTMEESLEIFGGPRGQSVAVLKTFLREAEKRGVELFEKGPKGSVS